MKDHSNVFINSKSASLWMLIVHGQPIFRTEFPYMVTDKEVYTLNNGAEELYEKLKNIKDNSNG